MTEADPAFALAESTTKQLITMASAIIAFTVPLLTGIVPVLEGQTAVQVLQPASKALIAASWISLSISLGSGAFTLNGLTGTVGQGTIWESQVRTPALIQTLGFFTGMALIVAFGIQVLFFG